MMSVYPRNKEYFLGLKVFGREILKICKNAEANPILWGSFAYFYYTKDKNISVNDIDFLIPDKKIMEIAKILKEKKIKHNYLEAWHCLQARRGKLKIELDPVEWYHKDTKLAKFDFDGIPVKIVKLEELARMYKKASKESKDKQYAHKKKLEKLIKLK